MKDYHQLARDVTFLRALFSLDSQIAEGVRAGLCRVCGGALHWASYPRVALGVIPSGLEREFSRRLSLCCGADGCRRRVTPPSVRFLGRRQYISVTFVLMSMLRHGITRQRAKMFHAQVGVDHSTLARWRRWWVREFQQTPVWRECQGRLSTAVDLSALPASLLMKFLGEGATQMMSLLRLMAPLSSALGGFGSSLVMGV